MTKITVGTATCGASAGADKVMETFAHLMAERGTQDVLLAETGCIGMCYREVLVEVANGAGTVLYGDTTPEKALRIFDEHVLGGQPVAECVVLRDYREGPESNFLGRQTRIALRNCGFIDPMSIDHYVERGGYRAIEKALLEMTPEELIENVLASGLRGRGGAGFPTGAKWQFARRQPGPVKYLICNADEGDPGAFMDRSVLEGDPHSVLEGMMLAGYAIGAPYGYIYCRAEYPKAIVRLRQAIADARARGWLERVIPGTDFSFEIKIKEGAGAFVCGEETALIGSIEGRRGTPRIRPPYPAVRGLWDKPTIINNVETLANLPWIVLNKPESFAAIGTEKSKGTKVFAVTGKVRCSGLVEVPMGLTINEVVFEICGGIQADRKFKAVQMGGPSGGCIPAHMGDTPIDYENITRTGAIMGSGGMVVMDETTCMVEMARFFLEFTQNESCGKCTACRIGTLRMLETLERIVEGQGRESDFDLLLELGQQIKSIAQCGLGQTAPNPVLTTLKYFREEYEAHIRDKKCPAHSCPLLVDYAINADRCTGCRLCAKDCSAGAITGEKKKAHVIDMDKCIKCGKCITVCNVDAVMKN
jgi:NADH-quinone oxidoreductase subunit F